MIQVWKYPHILKGALTWVPMLDAWRIRRASTGGSDSPRYCYSVWLRHLVMLARHGFKIKGAKIGELGPGDSIGIGLAALLSGAKHYVGLDVVPFSKKADLNAIFDELVELYIHREPIPDNREFPRVRPALDSYNFPEHLVDWTDFDQRIARIRKDLKGGLSNGRIVDYRAPWNSLQDIARGTLDLIFSQAVLEHVDCLAETYRAMFAWLKPGGYASHVIDFSCHGRSPVWNGHWAYADWEWTLVRGRREFLLNREPVSSQMAALSSVGFEIVSLIKEHDDRGFCPADLSSRFRDLLKDDVQTRGVLLILRKPSSA